jgi:hypothetical protein
MIEFVESVFVKLERVELPIDVMNARAGERLEKLGLARTKELLDRLHIAANLRRLSDAHPRGDDCAVRVKRKLPQAMVNDFPSPVLAGRSSRLLEICTHPLLAHPEMTSGVAERGTIPHHLERPLFAAVGVDRPPGGGLSPLAGLWMASCSRAAQSFLGRDRDPIREVADRAYRAETSHSLFRQVRKALGPDRWPAIAFHLASMATGDFTSASTQQDLTNGERQADLRAMDVALGLGHARTDTVGGVGPIINGDYSSILRDTFAPFADMTLSEFLKKVDPERLRTVTRDFSALTQSIAAASEEFSKTLAKDAFGLGRVALLTRSERKSQASLGLMWTLVEEKSAGKFHDLSSMAQSFTVAAVATRQSARPDKSADGLNAPIFRRGPTRKPIK